MRIVLVVGLVLVIFDLDEVGICGGGIDGKGNEGVNSGSFGDDSEGPGLLRISYVFLCVLGRGVDG